MRVGIFVFPDKLSKFDKKTVDFVEFPLSVIASLQDDEYQILRKQVKDSGIPVEVFNSFIPPRIKLVGPEANNDLIRNYIKSSLARAADFGAATVIFGSGKARQIYCEQDKLQMIEIARMMADEALQYNITVVAEPLNSNETNFITTVKEGFEFAKQVNRSNFKTMVDFYHFSKMNEKTEDLIFAKDMIAHVHIANYDRRVPELSEIPILKEWSKMLREINYDGRISIEAKYQDFDLEMLQFKDIFKVFKT